MLSLFSFAFTLSHTHTHKQTQPLAYIYSYTLTDRGGRTHRHTHHIEKCTMQIHKERSRRASSGHRELHYAHIFTYLLWLLQLLSLFVCAFHSFEILNQHPHSHTGTSTIIPEKKCSFFFHFQGKKSISLYRQLLVQF